MKKPILLILISFLFLTQNVFSQRYIEMMSDTNINFFEVQKAFNDYWSDRNSNVKGKGYKQFKRWENFWENRINPDGSIPKSALYEGFKESQRSQSRSSSNPHSNSPSNQFSSNTVMASSSASGGPWIPIGPNFVPRTVFNRIRGIGRLNMVSFHPTDANTMLVGSPSGGVWRTSNGGENWDCTTDFMPRLGVGDIAFHPTNPNIIFWATGDPDGYDTYANGIFRSNDGGNTWTQTTFPTSVQTISRLLIQPNNPNIMIVSTSSGIYRSTDAGNSWTQTQTGNFNCIEFKPNNYNTLYAAGRQNGQFWRSIDNGVNWTNITSGIPSSGTSRGKIAVSPNNNNYVYIIFCDPENSFYGIYRSIDSGLNFSERHRCETPSVSDPNLLGWREDGSDYGGQGWYDLSMAVNPNNVNDVWVGGVNIWQSTNGGSSWSNKALWNASGQDKFVHADIHELEFSPHNNTLYVCSDGGISKRVGNNWEDISNDLEITQFYSIGVAETIEDNVIGGAQDNGTLHHRIDYNSPDDWKSLISGDGMQCIINPNNPNIMYGETQYGKIFRTSDGGENWMNISPETEGAWETPYEIGPLNPDRMVAGYNQLYLSLNGGLNWNPLPSSSGLLNGNNINEIELTSENTIFYFSYSNNLFRTINGGISWTNISNTLTSYEKISDIHCSTSDPNRIWITFGGTWEAGSKVFHSSDGGTNWTNITHDLPNIAVNCITLDETNNRLFVGTDLGVFRREGEANTWINYNLNSLPNVIVKDLEINQSKYFLYAGTHGRGVWKIDISENMAPTANFSASSLDVCANEDIQFTDLSIGGPTSWSWNFGDGNNSTQQNPTHLYNTQGIYTVTLNVANTNGSDSETKIFYITVHPPASTQTLHINECESYTFTEVDPPITYTENGVYTVTSLNGCLTTTLYINLEEAEDPIYSAITACETYTWSEDGQTYTESGFYQHVEPPVSLTNVCGTEYWLDLNIIENVDEDVEACEYYYIAGVPRYTSGTYYEISTNPACTTRTVNLSINQPQGEHNIISTCEPYFWYGQLYEESGTYHFNFYENGCLGTHVLNLNIHSPTTNSTNITTCDSYNWNGTNYTSSGIYTYETTNANGCLHTEILNLTIINPQNTFDNVTACYSYTWPVNNQTYFTSGIYTNTINNQNCLSINTLNLTINPQSGTQIINQTSSGSYEWFGTTYFCSGTYTNTYTGPNGCVTNVILNLTITNPIYSTENRNECDEYYWEKSGQTYNTGGIKTTTVTVPGQNCNATSVLSLTLNYSSNDLFDVSANDSYTWHGETYYCSGTYYYYSTNSHGCPHMETLNLEIDNGW